MNAALCYSIFDESIRDYHRSDHVDAPLVNPHPAGSIEQLLYLKNWIDTVQWHLEDLIRDPHLDPVAGMALKRRIDASNQHRTDTVERIDDWFLAYFKEVTPQPDARLNSETPAWLVDRMSILTLKIWHMREQTQRTDTAAAHRENCSAKLALLVEQKTDLGQALDELLADMGSGRRRMKVYRQVKMYNDATLNPVLYKPVVS